MWRKIALDVLAILVLVGILTIGWGIAIVVSVDLFDRVVEWWLAYRAG